MKHVGSFPSSAENTFAKRYQQTNECRQTNLCEQDIFGYNLIDKLNLNNF
jgi:hypothetical protein